jgi:hypothetical protein
VTEPGGGDLEPLQPGRPVGRGLRIAGPEVVAALLSIVVVASAVLLFGGSPLGESPPGAGAEPSGSAAAEGSPAAPRPSERIDRAIADLLISVGQELLDAGVQLTEEVERDPSRAPEIATLVRQVNATARYGSDALPALGTTSEAQDLIAQLGPIYDELQAIADDTLRSSITNTAAYEEGAIRLIQVIDRLPPLQAELEALRDAPVVVSAPPSAPASAAVEPSASPAPPSQQPDPSASAPPSLQPDPSGSLVPGGSPGPGTIATQLINGGFEEGVVTGWSLVAAPGVEVSIDPDELQPAAGTASARIDIATATPAFSGISLQQEGIRLSAGAPYTVQVALRAEAAREVRVRVASQSGDAYLTRIAAVGTTWSVASFTFLAPASDQDAVLQIELGRSDATTWVDEVVLGASSGS